MGASDSRSSQTGSRASLAGGSGLEGHGGVCCWIFHERQSTKQMKFLPGFNSYMICDIAIATRATSVCETHFAGRRGACDGLMRNLPTISR